MKSVIVLLLIVQSFFAYSQNNKLIKLLNAELKKELKRIEKNLDAEKFEVTQYYHLRDSILLQEEHNEDVQAPRAIWRADLKILTLEVKKKNPYTGKTYTEKQEVNLGMIEKLIKDINIIFETQPEAVLVTTTDENGEITTRRTNLFFLQLNQEKNNEYLADKIVKTINAAGYYIEKGIWAD